MICHTADNIYTIYLTVEACVICSCVPLMSEVSILTANHPFVPQSKLKCHCWIEHLHCFENCRVHTEYYETCWQREGGEKKWSEERQGVPWQLFHTHTHTQNMQETRHIRGHSWQKCKEEGWDRNNKQIMFMDSIYLIAVCVYECMGEYSVSSDCNPTTRLLGPFQVNLYG